MPTRETSKLIQKKKIKKAVKETANTTKGKSGSIDYSK